MGTSSVDHLPGEIIELILSRCPAKSVFRFKSVSRSWLSIISDPRFSRTHQSKQSGKFLVWVKNKQQQYGDGYTTYFKGYTIYVMRMEDGQLQRESVVMPLPLPFQSQHFEPPFQFPLCYCHGLFLLRAQNNYILWNPSITKHTIIPSKFDTTDFFQTLWHHMYHDATTDDYKIVFCKTDYCYAVYSCNNESWGEMKHFPPDLDAIGTINVFVDGCFYAVRDDQIVCFDLRVGKLHKFPQPNDVECCDTYLSEVSGQLCLIGLNQGEGWPGYGFDLEVQKFQMWVMVMEENNNGSSFDKRWRKLMCVDQVEELKYFTYPTTTPLCLGTQDDVVFLASGEGMIQNFMYNPRPKTFQELDFPWTCCACCQYSENLYMPSSNIV